MAETKDTRRQTISMLTRSPHGALSEYIDPAIQAIGHDEEFYAHLVAWNAKKGQIRDAKVAMPVLALTGDGQYDDNAFAHIAQLDPRLFLRAVEFARDVHKARGDFAFRPVRRLVERYLRDLEAHWPTWERRALQHRKSLRALYAKFHVAPVEKANQILFKGETPPRSLFAAVKKLATAGPTEAGGIIARRKIPFLVARGVLGAKLKNADLLVAIVNAMTPVELVTNAKALEKLGAMGIPAVRAAIEAKRDEATTTKAVKRGGMLKTAKAAKALGDTKLGKKLAETQEKQVDTLMGVDGDWLVLADKSSSMHSAIKVAREVSSVLARVVSGKVHLVWFDSAPRYMDVSGKSLPEIEKMTAGVSAGGGTCIGSGLDYALKRSMEVDGIAIVSDGGEWMGPTFADVYAKYVDRFGKDVPVYQYECPGDPNRLEDHCAQQGIDLQKFEMGRNVDYHSLPNLVQTMRTNQYSLADEIYGVPLLTLDGVLSRTKGMELVRTPLVEV